METNVAQKKQFLGLRGRPLKILGIGVLLLLVVVFVLLALYRQRSMPLEQGTLRISELMSKTGNDSANAGSALSAELTIERDADAVPTIRAKSLNDAWFAMGFVHAQERLWQMEMQRRIGAGQLAEILGPSALDTDKFLRTLGIRRTAAVQFAKLDAPTKEALTRYSKGVNTAIAQITRDGMLPPEFQLLRTKPQAWEPEDCVAWSLMMSWDVGSNWTKELSRMQLSQSLSAEQINQVLPLTSSPPVAIRDFVVLYRSLGLTSAQAESTQNLLAMVPRVGVEGIGSNSWVLASSRSTTGKPLLANDPHLSLQAPSLWYLAKIEAQGYSLAGGTLPGLPFIVLGRNQHVAWGFTDTGSDVQDLFLERFNPADPNSVLGPAGLEPTQLVLETIKIKGEKDLPLNVRTTSRGPLISDVHEGTKKALGNSGFGISMRWTALDESNSTLQAGLKMNMATSAVEFEQALREYSAPTQNIIFSDAAGTIGFVAVGNVPIRLGTNDLQGLAPAPAWEAKYQWQGYVPFEKLPREINPARGYIATANNNILPDGYPYFIGAEWALPFRAQRISQLIEAKPQHDALSMQAIQGDVQSLAFPALMRTVQSIGGITPTTELGKQAWALLQGFDGAMSADKPEPLIANAWQQQLARQIFADEISAEAYKSLTGRRDLFGATLLAVATNSAMCDDITTPEKESCAQTLAKALDEACKQLAEKYGGTASKWRWGEAHVARSEHRPFGKVPVLSRLFDVRMNTPGDTNTVNVGKPANTGDAPFTNVHSASFRGIYDMAKPDASWLMQSTGQSGHRLSPHYADFSERWAAVQFLDVAQSKPDKVLKLQP
jgi:penicillin G amidase